MGWASAEGAHRVARAHLMTASHPSGTDRFRLLGVDVSAVRFEQALRLLLEAPAAGRRLGVHFITVHTLVEGSDDPLLREQLNAADLVCPDGMPLVWIGRLRRRAIERVYGPDTMLALIDRGREQGARHYFYGGAEGVPELLAEKLSKRFPGLVVAGCYSPPFRPLTPAEDEQVVARINEARADYVWVGLGSPKQDHWVAEHRGRIEAAALLAVGAAFDFHSGRAKEAPRWMKRSGLQWLHRLLTHPRRLWRRYTVVNTRFLWSLARDLVRELSSLRFR